MIRAWAVVVLMLMWGDAAARRPAVERATLVTFGWQGKDATPVVPEWDVLEIWKREDPDTTWVLEQTLPLAQSGTVSVWVWTTTRVRARSVRILPEIYYAGRVHVPEQRLYSGWSNVLRLERGQLVMESPPREHVRTP